jgi:hypothetical protein
MMIIFIFQFTLFCSRVTTKHRVGAPHLFNLNFLHSTNSGASRRLLMANKIIKIILSLFFYIHCTAFMNISLIFVCAYIILKF